jgi:hypothetical protein
LEERITEVENLKRNGEENVALKARILDLEHANDREKKLLEEKLKHVIHNQEGQLNSQRIKISRLETALNDELSVSQNKIAEQENEIRWLKRYQF